MALRIDIVTVFPEMVSAALSYSIIKRAMDRGLADIRAVDLRAFATDRHRTTDDVPYGGGGGMVMKIGPIARCLEALAAGDTERPRIVLTDPRGRRFDQALARELAAAGRVVLLCGHYEGVDDRVRQHLVTDEVSIGDFVLTGGELPALMITDAIVRLQPGALGDEYAASRDTFEEGLLEYPHYTRPRSFEGWQVPDVVLSGHHAVIERWRRWHQLRETRDRRPDLFHQLELSDEDRQLLSADEPQAPPESLPKQIVD